MVFLQGEAHNMSDCFNMETLTQPTEPTQPNQPSTPTWPSQPTIPTDPTQPSAQLNFNWLILALIAVTALVAVSYGFKRGGKK